MSVKQNCVEAKEITSRALLFEADNFFNETYQQGLKQSDTPDAKRRPERFYNTVQLFLQTLDLPGNIAECGCWKGLSSYMLCSYMRAVDEDFKGEKYHIFDSFQGLNSPADSDNLPEATTKSLQSKFGTVRGAFQADLNHVRHTLVNFPRITFHRGWIPDIFGRTPARNYRFVHIDVDLYEPTLGAVEYFYPRLVQGGLIVCDDYGSLAWPGAKRAIDEYCQRQGLNPLILSTGQAVLFKKTTLPRSGPGNSPSGSSQPHLFGPQINRFLRFFRSSD